MILPFDDRWTDGWTYRQTLVVVKSLPQLKTQWALSGQSYHFQVWKKDMTWFKKLFIYITWINFYSYLVTIERRMTPAAHTSTAVLWVGLFNKTSGGLKPAVPARGACKEGRDKQISQTAISPLQSQMPSRCSSSMVVELDNSPKFNFLISPLCSPANWAKPKSMRENFLACLL